MTTNIESKEVVVSIGGQIITGKNAICTEMNINHQQEVMPILKKGSRNVKGFQALHKLCEISLQFVCQDLEHFYDIMNGNSIKKIRNMKVDDCSIKELLFAIRNKINGGKKNGK